MTRKPGSFAAFMRGLDRLLEAGIKVRLKAMALRSNAKDYFRFDPLLHLRYDRDPQRNEEIRSERLSREEIVAIEGADEQRSHAMKKGCGELIMPDLAHTGCDHLFHCGAGKGSFYVTHDGKFRLCSSLCHPDCTYDLRQGSLTDAWRNFAPKVQAMRSNRKQFLESCRVCPIINLCLWCPAHAHLETGELDGGVEYFCDVAHARAQALRTNLL